MRSRLLIVMVCVLGVLSACAAPSGGPMRITLGFSAWPGWLPWQVANEKRIFAVNGVEVELKFFDSYAESLTALSSGAIDANSQTLSDTISSVSGGAQQTIVLANDTSTGNDQIIARAGIHTVTDLKGKKIAVEEGTVDHYLLLLALDRADLDERDVQVVPTPTDAAAATFAAGHVDAVAAFAPYTTTALSRTGSRLVATSAEFPESIPDLLVVRKQLAAKQPAAVQRLVNAWFETVDWIKRNPAEATAIMARRAGVTPRAYYSYEAGTTFLTRQENLAAFRTGQLDRQARVTADFMQRNGLTPNRPTLVGLFDDQFVKTAAVPVG